MSEINLHALFAETPAAGTTPSRPATGPSAAEELRLNLAVRGWTRPLDLIGTDTGGISAIAPEAETAAGLHPGKWFLTVSARIATLAEADETTLLAACQPQSPGDRTDPVLHAFAEALSPAPLTLGNLDNDTLKAMVNVNSWLGPRWHQAVGTEQLNAEIAARTLSADLARMTAQPMVGAVHLKSLEELLAFTSRSSTHWLTYAYVYASGGGGKTTLLANLQLKLAQAPRLAAIARIDFDEPAIDPGRMITLNLALFEQLAANTPALAVRLGSALPELRRSAAALRTNIYDQSSPFDGSWAGTSSPQASLAAQKSLSESAWDQSSILYRLLAQDCLGGPLVLIFDTAELVMTDNDRAAAGIVAWLDFLHREAGAEDIRLIIAGRDPPPPAAAEGASFAAPDLLTRLGNLGRLEMPPSHLPELTGEEADALLNNCGVKDEALRRAAVSAVPGNPLLLRLTADALMAADADFAAEVHAAHAMAQVDARSAQNYLTRRVMAHVSDPQARPFVIPAMASPFLTLPILREIISVVGQGGVPDLRQDTLPGRVFKSFGAAVWLGRMSLDGKTFTFNRDLRRLAETLVEAIADDKKQWQKLHTDLCDYHSQRSTSLDRALTVYHAAVLGHGYKLPRGPRVIEILREIFDQLPSGLQDKLVAKSRTIEATLSEEITISANVSGGSRATSDRDWTLYLEGNGKRTGQGEQLVQEDQAAEALKLYRDRPTRVPGLPPTFVIQAFADLGTWQAREIDLAALVRDLAEKSAQNRKGLSPDALSRLYWVTRFAMIANAGKLSKPHLDLIARTCDGLRGPGLTTLPALIAIAEAQSGRQLMNQRLIAGIRGHEAEARVALARHAPVAGEFPVGQIAVTQCDWLKRLARVKAIDSRPLDWVQQVIDELGGKPSAAVNQTFAEARKPVPCKWDGHDLKSGILLLRGHTVEILRPLRETLAALYIKRPNQVIGELIKPTIERMSVRPIEFALQSFRERLVANPRSWLTGFVGFADRARLLRGLCERIAASSLWAGQEQDDAVRVARAFIAWDSALCGGGSSEWGKD